MAGLTTLFDTNILSEPLRKTPNPNVLRRLRDAEHVGAIAAPALHQIRFGALRLIPSSRQRAIGRFITDILRMFPILPYDEAAAEWHARERARLVSIGRTPPFVDSQIAAVAAVNRLRIATLNVRDFASFEGLEIDDWSR